MKRVFKRILCSGLVAVVLLHFVARTADALSGVSAAAVARILGIMIQWWLALIGAWMAIDWIEEHM